MWLCMKYILLETIELIPGLYPWVMVYVELTLLLALIKKPYLTNKNKNE